MNWKTIPEAPAYEVSESGLVRRVVVPNRILKTYLDNRGYEFLSLSVNKVLKNFRIHKVVLRVFGPPQPSPKHHCAHNDGNRLHNHYTNLRWASKRENESDKKIHGTSDSNLQEIDVIIIRQQLRMKLKTGNELARIFGVNIGTISNIKKRHTWKYLEEFVGSEGKSILESAEGHLFYSEDYGDIDACALMNDLREYSL